MSSASAGIGHVRAEHRQRRHERRPGSGEFGAIVDELIEGRARGVEIGRSPLERPGGDGARGGHENGAEGQGNQEGDPEITRASRRRCQGSERAAP